VNRRVRCCAPDHVLLDQLLLPTEVRWHYWEIGCGYTSSSTRRAVCAQRIAITAPSQNLCEIEKYHYLLEKILNAAERRQKAGTFCMVISGRTPQSQTSPRFWMLCRSEGEIRFKICTCLGLLSEEQTQRLRQEWIG